MSLVPRTKKWAATELTNWKRFAGRDPVSTFVPEYKVETLYSGTARHRNCPFRKRLLPFLRLLENFWPVIESVSFKKKENRKAAGSNPDLEPGAFVSLSLFLTTALPHRPAKIPKNLSSLTKKLFFLTDT